MSLTTAHIVFDCTNAVELASFWASLLEVPVDPEASPFFATVGASAQTPLSPVYMFIQVPDEHPKKNNLHVDLVGPDGKAQVERAISLGARHVADFDEWGTVWTTLADPEDNLFDIAGQ